MSSSRTTLLFLAASAVALAGCSKANAPESNAPSAAPAEAAQTYDPKKTPK